jgi:hypothetical protein
MSSGELLQNLKVLADRLGEPLDLESLALDEHLRMGPYFRLLRDSSEDTIYESVGLAPADPASAMRTSVVVSWIDHIAKSNDLREFSRWIQLVRTHIDSDEFLSRRSSETEFFLRCEEGDAASIADLASGPAWVQRQLAQTCELPEVLEELGTKGLFKKIRAQAKHRLSAIRRSESKKLPYLVLQESARVLTRQALSRYSFSDTLKRRIGMDAHVADHSIEFVMSLAAEKPLDSIPVSKTRMNRFTGEGTVEVFPENIALLNEMFGSEAGE